MKRINWKQCTAFLLSLLMLMGLFTGGSFALAAVNIQFDAMDTTVNQNNGNNVPVTRSVSSVYTEGTGAVKFEWTADHTGGLFWYMRWKDYKNTSLDINGATHMIFDFYINDTTMWELFPGDSGGTRVNLNDSGSGWDNNACGQVTVATMKAAFAEVKNGWNHMVLTIDGSNATSTELNHLRLYFSGATCKSGFYVIMDDVRFVDLTYLESAAYADTIAAKDVIAQISVLTDASTEAEIAAARNAYDSLTADQKELVSNLAKLEGYEQALNDKAAAKVVQDQIDELNVQSLNDKPTVATARAAYDGLTDAQKGLVTNLAKLQQAEAEIVELEEAADKSAAKVVQDQIDVLNVQSLDDKADVVAARAAYNALTDTQKGLVTNLAKLEAAEEKIAELEKPIDPPVVITYGDVDGNGKVEATDALEVLKSVVGKVNLTDEQLVKADTDGNGKADATDALNILKKVVGKIDKFPVEQ